MNVDLSIHRALVTSLTRTRREVFELQGQLGASADMLREIALDYRNVLTGLVASDIRKLQAREFKELDRFVVKWAEVLRGQLAHLCTLHHELITPLFTGIEEKLSNISASLKKCELVGCTPDVMKDMLANPDSWGVMDSATRAVCSEFLSSSYLPMFTTRDMEELFVVRGATQSTMDENSTFEGRIHMQIRAKLGDLLIEAPLPWTDCLSFYTSILMQAFPSKLQRLVSSKPRMSSPGTSSSGTRLSVSGKSPLISGSPATSTQTSPRGIGSSPQETSRGGVNSPNTGTSTPNTAVSARGSSAAAERKRTVLEDFVGDEVLLQSILNKASSLSMQ